MMPKSSLLSGPWIHKWDCSADPRYGPLNAMGHSMRCLVSFALALTLAAQDAPFGVQSRLVLVPVNVTDAKGRTVDGLESKDFVVLDNGRPQKATVDTAGTGVAHIALAVA